ncbi:hypothetical protein L3V79_02120 [Thiotrichales bacterium 19S9-12]|nr:hypothetical protein [Thiotrichales bacterium 19S9-11]MCF6811154.1 hypothetical protein [Thiotrichales bacterium 19S9-12]
MPSKLSQEVESQLTNIRNDINALELKDGSDKQALASLDKFKEYLEQKVDALNPYTYTVLLLQKSIDIERITSSQSIRKSLDRVAKTLPQELSAIKKQEIQTKQKTKSQEKKPLQINTHIDAIELLQSSLNNPKEFSKALSKSFVPAMREFDNLHKYTYGRDDNLSKKLSIGHNAYHYLNDEKNLTSLLQRISEALILIAKDTQWSAQSLATYFYKKVFENLGAPLPENTAEKIAEAVKNHVLEQLANKLNIEPKTLELSTNKKLYQYVDYQKSKAFMEKYEEEQTQQKSGKKVSEGIATSFEQTKHAGITPSKIKATPKKVDPTIKDIIDKTNLSNLSHSPTHSAAIISSSSSSSINPTPVMQQTGEKRKEEAKLTSSQDHTS